MKKTTTTALLLFLALFTLTTNLIAQKKSGQQARKQGWFVGVSPYFLGAKIKTTIEHTTLTERYTEGTRSLGCYKRSIQRGTSRRFCGTSRIRWYFSSSDAIDSRKMLHWMFVEDSYRGVVLW